jgi:formylglycine-generating enzyme required for sulfatase activity
MAASPWWVTAPTQTWFFMHGNAADWTRSIYRSYPYVANDGRNEPANARRRAARGGSFLDHPKRCRNAFRLAYPTWQRVFNVGLRVVCEGDEPTKELVARSKPVSLR